MSWDMRLSHDDWRYVWLMTYDVQYANQLEQMEFISALSFDISHMSHLTRRRRWMNDVSGASTSASGGNNVNVNVNDNASSR